MANRINYFLAYMRQGITTLAAHDQVRGKRMTIPVKLTITASDRTNNTDRNDLVEKVVSLFGPGDVLGINENVISRLAPLPNVNNFQPSLTPFIQFSEPDFLWRFSSLQTADKKNWMPWLSLIILKSQNGDEEGEYEMIQQPNKALPRQIQLKPNAVLPDLKESWRWAHVHKLDIEKSDATQIVNNIKTTPEKTVCRLLSPRRLKPQTKYHAFLVPAFKIGAEAAMGIVDGEVDRTKLTWETPAAGAGQTLPYYYDWEFGTDTKGEFENLVRKLKPTDLENMGTRLIDCSNPGYGMQEEKLELQMEAALKSLDTNLQSWGMDSTDGSDLLSKKKQEELANLLNKREENVNGNIKLRVTPPVYGEWYASREGESIKVNAQNRNHWLEELNLDFRHRAAAGLGVQFVKENQENLMLAAWEQLSKIKKVNQELNLGRFGREVSACMYQRLNKMKPNNLFQIALPVQNKIAFQPAQTIGAVLRDSTITNNLTKTKFKKYFFKMKREEMRSDFKPVDTSALVSLSYKVKRVKGLRDGIPATDVTAPRISFAAISTWPEGVVDETIKALDPKTTIESRIKNRISRFRNIEATKVVENTQTQQEDELRPVKWYPEFHRPMYHFLRDLSQEYILPGLENVPQNAVGLLQTNRRFIEAFMMGLNHEMAAELRWREFPTDLRGSYFRSFWDTSIYSVDENEKVQFRNTDIGLKFLEQIRSKYGDTFGTFPAIENLYIKAEPNETEKEIANAYENAIEQWLLTRDEDKDIEKLAHWKKDNRLGDNPVEGKWTNQEEDQNQIVLLVRGELLQKFSNTLIYLVEKKTDSKPNLDLAARRTFPVFEGALPPDIVFIGFPIKEAEVDKYFVVFEERMTELRFGLDVEATTGTGENDLSWEHFPTLPPEGYLDGIQPTILTQQWNNAAFIGKVMVQKQVRAAIALATLLPD